MDDNQNIIPVEAMVRTNRYSPQRPQPPRRNRKSIRLKGYDYSQAGLYFITICCQDRICRFGIIKNGEMILNAYGKIAHDAWLETPNIRPNVVLHEFIIMPNHMHGIIRIVDSRSRGESHSPQNELHLSNNQLDSPNEELHSPHNELHVKDDMGVGKTDGTISEMYEGECNSTQPPQQPSSPPRSPSQTVGAMVRGYKSSVTKQCGLMGFTGKLWQRNYYEHIIRNEIAYQRISQYIINNPKNWGNDKLK